MASCYMWPFHYKCIMKVYQGPNVITFPVVHLKKNLIFVTTLGPWGLPCVLPQLAQLTKVWRSGMAWSNSLKVLQGLKEGASVHCSTACSKPEAESLLETLLKRFRVSRCVLCITRGPAPNSRRISKSLSTSRPCQNTPCLFDFSTILLTTFLSDTRHEQLRRRHDINAHTQPGAKGDEL